MSQLLSTMEGYRLVDINTAKKAEFVSLQQVSGARIRFVIRELLLKPGTYPLALYLGRDYIEEADSLDCAQPWRSPRLQTVPIQ